MSNMAWKSPVFPLPNGRSVPKKRLRSSVLPALRTIGHTNLAAACGNALQSPALLRLIPRRSSSTSRPAPSTRGCRRGTRPPSASGEGERGRCLRSAGTPSRGRRGPRARPGRRWSRGDTAARGEGFSCHLIRLYDALGSVDRSERTPFHVIWTPMQKSRKDESRTMTLIAVSPSTRASRSAKP